MTNGEGMVAEPAEKFVATPAVAALCDRALAYLRAGFPVHFRGLAGTGKTSLALEVARQRGRPVLLLTGDHSYSSANLVGGEVGVRTRRVVDRYVASVLKTQTETVRLWADQPVTTACTQGYTLVYDEFTRSPPEANNALLSALEEKVLVLPSAARGNTFLPVHPEFRILFTSNPLDYAGVHRMPDALADRMVTIEVGFMDRDTEITIVSSRSQLPPADCAPIVDIVRDFRASGAWWQPPTLRAGIMIATIARQQAVPVAADDPDFVQLCLDILSSKLKPDQSGGADTVQLLHSLTEMITHFAPPRGLREVA